MKRSRYLLSLLFVITTSIVGAMDLTLEEYLQLVEDNSKDLYSAQLDQSLAETQEDLARSQILPMAAATVEYNRNLEDIYTSYPTSVTTSSTAGTYALNWSDVDYNDDNQIELTVGVTQNIFNMSMFKAIEASKKYKSLTGTIYEAKRQGIITVAKKVYFQTLLLEQVYEVKKKTLDHSYETYADVEIKFQNEVASELDVLQAKVNWEMNIPEVTLAERNLNLALTNLKFLGGIDPEEELNFTIKLDEVENKSDDTSLPETLANRPDFQALKQTRDLREINISAKMADFYPTVQAAAGYYRFLSSDNWDFEDVDYDAVSVGVTVTVPIFYGGSRIASLKQAKLELEQAEVEIKQKQDEIENEYNNIKLLLDEATSRVDVAKTTLKTATRAYEITEVSYKNGLATNLELKDTLLSLEGAQLQYYVANYDLLEAFFDWQQITGQVQ